MRNYKDNDYALNKYSKGIVYQFADETREVTLEDFLKENPHKTPEDFEAIKALSDEIYYQQDRQEHRTNRRNVSLTDLEETELLSVPSVETEWIQQEEREKVWKAAEQLLKSGSLTEIQQRRFQQHYFQGLSIRQIARCECVQPQTVWESLMWAQKKFKKFLAE
ncbi:MAG: sigma-70 family RNA polymerase sigma factor [Lachnospiraceae bacterium]|nr:sigma-70 family RNA polymerase sigma factor [Lachnospiraceae bacterium]